MLRELEGQPRLRALPARQRPHPRRRRTARSATAAAVVDELVGLIERGHEVAPGDGRGGGRRARRRRERPAEILEDVIWRHRGIKVAPKTVNQKRYVDSIREHTVTFGIGPAGTGKTFLAVAMAVAALDAREVSRIILTRPAVEAGERLGFLPGRHPGEGRPVPAAAVRRALRHARPGARQHLLRPGIIEVAPLAFMRGRTLNDSFVILDEAQNTSPEQMKMFLTRLGFGSRMVVTGDMTQIDLPRDQRSGLVVVGEILPQVEDIAFIRFGGEDVVRHELVQRIVAAYGEYERASSGASERLTARPRRRPRRAARGGRGGARARRGRRRPPVRRAGRARSGSASSTASTAASTSRPTCSRSRSTAPGEVAGPRELGDVVICPRGRDDVTEATVHGVLHLCGYDHETDEGEMLGAPGPRH